MNCCCGDPSCGYCQAARVPHSNNYYPFEDFIPMDPFAGHLRTIYEEDENNEISNEKEKEGGLLEEDEEDDDVNDYDDDEPNQENQEIIMIGEINQLDLESERISNNQINELQVRITFKLKKFY